MSNKNHSQDSGFASASTSTTNPKPICGSDVFQALKIEDRRWNKKQKRYEFLVKWFGYPPDHNSWEPIDNILDTRLIDEFEGQGEEKDEVEKHEQKDGDEKRSGKKKKTKKKPKKKADVAEDNNGDGDESIKFSNETVQKTWDNLKKGVPVQSARDQPTTSNAEELGAEVEVANEVEIVAVKKRKTQATD